MFGRLRSAITPEGETRIIQAIRDAESRTSGEIRVHVDLRCPGDPLEVAKRQFARLGMTATAERNGVLIYLAARDRKLAVVGDEGIHARVGEESWCSIRDLLERKFRAGDLVGGLEEGIAAVGEFLSRFFPRRDGDIDELKDSISTDGSDGT